MAIIDDKFVNIKNDIEKIQAKPNMYISYIGNRASLHLAKELVNNVIDEDANENTISDGTCDMMFDEKENKFYIRDHGRGIAFEELENACTILHSGTKMTREHGTTGGENGVGMSACNSLSDEFEITSYRDGQARSILFNQGKKVSDNIIKIRSKNDHGLQVMFKPSQTFLGNDVQLPIDELRDWLEKLSYTVDSDRLKFKLSVNYIGKDAPVVNTYKSSDIGGFLSRFAPTANLLKTPVILNNKSTIIENDIPIRQDDGSVILSDMSRDLIIDVVINYDITEETKVFSFCNDIETIEHGQHVVAATNTFISFIKKKLKESSKKEIEVTNNDILYGLSMVVNMKTNFSRGLFTSQTKHKMDNRDLYEPMKKLIASSLEDFFKLPANEKILSKILGIVKDNIKARQAATKARKKVNSKRMSYIETQLIKDYVAPNLIEKEPDLPFELYIIEGDSAGGNARSARYSNDIQGTFGLTGKPSQVYGNDSAFIATKALDVKKFFDDILGCGFDEHFDLNKLIYKKIIIATDADVDGDHIASIVIANIYKHARPLLDMGYVYRVKAPLYRLRELDNEKIDKATGTMKIDLKNYIFDKDEYFAKYEDNVSLNIKLKIDPGDDFVSRKQMVAFLKVNRDYYECLDRVSKQRAIHKDILEYLAMNDAKDINKTFPELYYDEEQKLIYGGYGLDPQSLLLDDVVMNDINYLRHVIMTGNGGILKYHTYKKFKSKSELNYLGHLTIGQIMDECQVYADSFSSRFKGLGEMNGDEMATLLMNPNNRVLIRITINEAEEEALNSMMDELFLEDMADARKQMVNSSIIHPDDIDN